jgi:dTDP-glucose pyrophosphorylase
LEESISLWERALLPLEATISDAVLSLERSAVKIAVVVDDAGLMHGTISDGDIRRGLIQGLDLKSSIENIVQNDALIVPPDIDRATVLRLMDINKIFQIPIVDKNNKVIGLHLWTLINESVERHNILVIMAGGEGTRLRPETEKCPKPLLPVNGKPILEHIIERAKLEGFTQFILAIKYLGHMIENYFGNGSDLGVQITYLREDSPLGTAGALKLINPVPERPFVVTNGDVMTDIKYGELLDFHTRTSAFATMSVRSHEWQHPFGVVKLDGIDVIGFEEKPVFRSHINAGVYVLEPGALEFLDGERCDMPSLFERCQKQNLKTIAYPMHEPWLDVGRPDDLRKANSVTKK